MLDIDGLLRGGIDMCFPKFLILDETELNDTIGFFYDVVNNNFLDEDGFIVWNMLEFVTPSDLYLFRHHQEYMAFRHRYIPGTICELYYPEEDVCY